MSSSQIQLNIVSSDKCTIQKAIPVILQYTSIFLWYTSFPYKKYLFDINTGTIILVLFYSCNIDASGMPKMFTLCPRASGGHFSGSQVPVLQLLCNISRLIAHSSDYPVVLMSYTTGFLLHRCLKDLIVARQLLKLQVHLS